MHKTLKQSVDKNLEECYKRTQELVTTNINCNTYRAFCFHKLMLDVMFSQKDRWHLAEKKVS